MVWVWVGKSLKTFLHCRHIYPGAYAELYRDYLHWFACCWHEDFIHDQSIASSHPGKRSDVIAMRSLNKNYRAVSDIIKPLTKHEQLEERDNLNPHDLEATPHHYRLIDTVLQQTKCSVSWKTFKDYQHALIAFTKTLDQQSYIWTLEDDGFSVIQGQGRPSRKSLCV